MAGHEDSERSTRTRTRATSAARTKAASSGRSARHTRSGVGERSAGRQGSGSRGRGKVSSRAVHTERQHLPEMVALVLFGVAVFILFSLADSQSSGVAGGAVRVALVYVFGRLAWLFPIALIVVASRLVFPLRLRPLRLVGVGVFLLGLFLFLGGAAPPFGERSEELFVRETFERWAGGLGEALYAGVHGLTGMVGVAVVSWLALIAGLSLATGLTGMWVAVRTRQAHTVIQQQTRRRLGTAADSASAAAAKQEDDDWPFPVATSSQSGSVRSGGEKRVVGPVDLVAEIQSSDRKVSASGQKSGTPGNAFEDWTRSASSGARVSGEGEAGRSAGVLDGAQAFADLFAAETGAFSPAPAQSQQAHPSSSAASVAETRAEAESGLEEQGEQGENAASRPEVLPGPPISEVLAGQHAASPAWELPEPYMLRKSQGVSTGDGPSQRETAAVLVRALAEFGVEARVVGMVVGPRVTRYELQLAPGTKVAKVSALKDDLAYALANTDIRILTPIPGKSAVGVEVPNPQAEWVTLGDIYHEFPKSAGPLMFWLGKDISGKAVYADLTRLPHLLIAGTTGSGKSGCVNCIVSSILLRATPDQVRMIMIDPKKVELSHYDRIPHLLVPVVTNMKDAAGVLHNVVKEMEERYELMELDHARNLPELNKVRARRGERPLPYILIVIDELADLMMTSPQEVEDYIIRIAQKARAVGIHLVVATQRPSADVITGMIKANIPSRIAFTVSSQVDSRVILDANGAETLLGAGDMLFKPLGSTHMQRVQGAYITEEETAVLVAHWRRQAQPEFREELLRRPEEEHRREDDLFDPDSDDLLPEAARLVIETGSASVSMLQRRLRVGYTRAGRLIDMLERRGIVGPWEGSKPRQILVHREEVDQVVAMLQAQEKTGASSEREWT